MDWKILYINSSKNRVYLIMRTYKIFENQIPSDKKGDKFADSDVTVNVGRSSLWYSCSKLSVAHG